MNNTVNSASQEWYSLVKRVAEAPTQVSRTKATVEILSHKSTIDSTRPIVDNVDRKLSMRYAFAEAYHILTGRDDVKFLEKYNPRVAEFYGGNKETLWGAYGPRFVEQVGYVQHALMVDEGTRQAVVSLWRLNPHNRADVPCTLSLQFVIRDKALHTIVAMRSSDTWMGWPYDIFTFTMMGAYVALGSMKDPKLGTTTIFAGSQHLYAPDIPKARACEDGARNRNPFVIGEFRQESLVDWLLARANGEEVDHLSLVIR